MDLRAELTPPSVSQQRLDTLCCEIERIADLVTSRSASADEAIRAFNARMGHDYVALDFAEYDASRSLVEFATEAARPARPRVAEITRNELVEMVHRIRTGCPETDYYLRLLEANAPHPRVSDLIFHPRAELRDATAEQIVDELLAYRPIAL
ncbi:hypothetical protein [Kitasatospora sp. NPDC089509]|uniref:hypothetical protein n=1 Tax=Kitasatospora sp. NPDC089509 TaxID=3364079 RepID=UPI0038097797